MNYYEEALNKRMCELAILKSMLENSLKSAPEGSLRVATRKSHCQYYHYMGNKDSIHKLGVYIRKRDKSLAAALAQKDYDQVLYDDICCEMGELSKLINKCYPALLTDDYYSLPYYRQGLVKPLVLSDEDYIKHWLSVPYPAKSFKEGDAEYFTQNGERVRSKSETIIADKLLSLGIPYRYEYPLILFDCGKEIEVHPDFTLLDMHTRSNVYFEHAGMLDDPEYCDAFVRKMNTYASNDIVLGKNLIVSVETSSVPLNIKRVEKMLEPFIPC